MKKNLFLSTACMALYAGVLTLSSVPAQAEMMYHHPRSTTQQDQITHQAKTVHYRPVSSEEYRDYKGYHWKIFREYHVFREPCQSYVAPPAGYIVHNCDVYYVDTAAATKTTVTTKETMPPVPYYPVYFDFDKSTIRADQRQNLAEIAAELKKHNLTEVTVAGHTDRAGSSAYNQNLSERRAYTVAQELERYGIKASVIDTQGFGETDTATKTADGVREPDNRRVTIHYKR